MNATLGLPLQHPRCFVPALALAVAFGLCGRAPAGDEPAPSHQLAPVFEEIVAMSEAGVSKELLVQFVESSPQMARPGGADIIAMKARGLPDEVIVTMMHRHAAQARAAQARETVAAPAIVRQLSTDGRLDPESYEFFWYHHAYPRALAGSYQTLAPYSPSHHPRWGRHRDRIPWRNDGFPGDALVRPRPATARLAPQQR